MRTLLLSKLRQDAGSTDIAALVGYAESEDARWTDEDQQSLVRIAEYYFEDRFDEELADLRAERDLDEFLETVSSIGDWCGIDVDAYRDQTNQAIADLGQSEEEHDQTPHQWETTGHPISEHMQEAEVRRLFDGLR